jgi:hypothetical protein
MIAIARGPCPAAAAVGPEGPDIRAVSALPSPLGGHDRGRVFSDLACAIVDGARVISDFRVTGDQQELSQASPPPA